MTEYVFSYTAFGPEVRSNMAWKYPLLERIAAGKDPWLVDHPSVERAMGVAWDSADPAGRRKIIATLLSRRQPEGMVVLIQRLHELDPGSRAELAQRIDRLQKPIRLVLSGSSSAQDLRAQINALLLIEAAGAGDLTYLVCEKLRSTLPEVRVQAENTLRGMAGRASTMPPTDAQRLTQSVNDAVVRFGNHKNTAALQAWLGLAPRGLVAGGAAIEALQDAEHPAVGPMRELLIAPEHPLVRAGLVACLAIPTLTLAAVQGMRRCFQNHHWGQAIEGREHLLDWSAVRRGLARAGEPEHLLPASWESQSEQAIAALPAWITALPISPLNQAIRLGHLTHHDAPRTARFAATRRLMDLVDTSASDPGAAADPRVLAEVRQQLLSRADDEDASISRLAATWLLRRIPHAGHDEEVLTALSRSRHEATQSLAIRRLAASAFDRLWDAWPRLNDASRLSAARAALKADPLAYRRLESQLKRGGSHRTRALEIVTCVPRPDALNQSFAGGAA
ncbi:hypothetical protein [Algisphaera agarilytica]|uniref:HEAT repeat-containing protein n=1 Tax=Algisphaera agarilytica TaxID=1385975 RepID=A0A7X0H6N0_9BACT|nr:hypothetical protein [Algisphaera agarilytica]MBB6428785.1 hypothetical protein [Algisphaera agarilytica]